MHIHAGNFQTYVATEQCYAVSCCVMLLRSCCPIPVQYELGSKQQSEIFHWENTMHNVIP